VIKRIIPLEDIEKYFIFKKFGWADEFQEEDFGMYSKGIFYTLQNRTEPGKPNVIALHTMLDQLSIKDTITYVKEWKEAIDLAKSNATAFHVDPVKPEKINEIAISGKRFPEKSTYFFPKLPSGLVIYKF
ncbi:MAG: hypothetical protein NTV30_03430, partial [Chloroflexi bacterium]|nr:hypothetical protein [Chloroflexota bacterium]